MTKIAKDIAKPFLNIQRTEGVGVGAGNGIDNMKLLFLYCLQVMRVGL